MAEYRAYTLGCDEHFTGFEPLVCADDAEAIEQAKRLANGSDIELWSGDRLVIRLKADLAVLNLKFSSVRNPT